MRRVQHRGRLKLREMRHSYAWSTRRSSKLFLLNCLHAIAAATISRSLAMQRSNMPQLQQANGD